MNRYPARRRLRTGMSAAAAIVVGANVYWAFSPGQPVAQDARVGATPSQAPAQQVPRLQSSDSGIAPTPQAPTTDPEASTIAEYTEQKYEFLLDDLRYLEASEVEQLRRALQTGAEDQIRAMLHPADYATYEMLRESDLELFKLNEYAGGISNIAPLSAADRESILMTKLAYKERFRQLLRDSGLQRSDLSQAEREYAYSMTSRALEDFRRDYLLEVRQYLANEEQFALLSNYEATEFKAELARFQGGS